MTHEPDVGRIYYEKWLAENPEPADDGGEGGNCMRGLLYALLLDVIIIAVIAALITFVMWVLR